MRLRRASLLLLLLAVPVALTPAYLAAVSGPAQNGTDASPATASSATAAAARRTPTRLAAQPAPRARPAGAVVTRDPSERVALVDLEARAQRLRPYESLPTAGFGASVALDGGVAVVGAPSELDASTPSGAAYVFVRGGDAWSLAERIVIPGETRIGDWVGVSGDTIVVTSRPARALGSQKTLHVFRRGVNGARSAWGEVQKIRVDDDGWDVLLHGTTLAVGRRGFVQLYECGVDGVFRETTRIVARGDGVSRSHFAVRMALDGDLLAITSVNEKEFDRDASGVTDLYRYGPGRLVHDATLVTGGRGGAPACGGTVFVAADFDSVHVRPGPGRIADLVPFENVHGQWDRAVGPYGPEDEVLHFGAPCVAARGPLVAVVDLERVDLFLRTGPAWRHARSSLPVPIGLATVLAADGRSALVGCPADESGGSAWVLDLVDAPPADAADAKPR